MRRQSKKSIGYLACLSSLLFLTGCEKYYLSLTDQNINVNYLASVGAGTPDKRQQNPPFGEMIVMDWRIPKELLEKQPVIDLHIIYGDYTEETFHYPLKKRMGYVTYKDLNEEYAQKKGIITYKADIRLEDGTIYRDWKHQLWANLITISNDPDPTFTPPASPPPPPFPVPKSPTVPPVEDGEEEHSDDDYEEDKNDSNGSGDDYGEENKHTSSEDMEDEDYEEIVDESDDDDSDSSADSMSSFVEDQSMQGSVTDTDDLMEEVSSDRG